MRRSYVIPFLLLMTATASAAVDDNFKTITARINGGAAGDWSVNITFEQAHVVFFENDSVPRGTSIVAYVSLTKNDFSDQWYGQAVVPTSAATFGPNLTYATLRTTLLLNRFGAPGLGQKAVTVNVRLDGVGDITGGRSGCMFSMGGAFTRYISRSFSSGLGRDAVLTSGTLSDGTTDYLSSFSPGYPVSIEETSVLFNTPGNL